MLVTLTSRKSVKLLYFNKQFLDSLKNRINHDNIEILKQLQSLAKKQGDASFEHDTLDLQKKIEKIIREKHEAELVASKAHDAKVKAEKRAEKAEKEVEVEKKEKEVVVAQVKTVTNAYEEEKKRNLFLSQLQSQDRDKEIIENFMHHIIGYAGAHKQKIKTTLSRIENGKYSDIEQVRPVLIELLGGIEKILETSKFATLANFRLDSGQITSDLTEFISGYLKDIAPHYQDKIKLVPPTSSIRFEVTFSPIEFGIVLSNLISNSLKAKASQIIFSSVVKNGIYELHITDNGEGLDSQIIEPDRIFEKGFTRTSGSGLGLYFCKQSIEKMNGSITVEPLNNHGLSIKLRISK
jgi:signal transduction histidine kinase